jgi:hypothetical protein
MLLTWKTFLPLALGRLIVIISILA